MEYKVCCFRIDKMEKAIRVLNDLFTEPEVLENDTLRVAVSDVISQLMLIIKSRKEALKEKRASSPCPCGTCED